jgi:hypothetical protein
VGARKNPRKKRATFSISSHLTYSYIITTCAPQERLAPRGACRSLPSGSMVESVDSRPPIVHRWPFTAAGSTRCRLAVPLGGMPTCGRQRSADDRSPVTAVGVMRNTLRNTYATECTARARESPVLEIKHGHGATVSDAVLFPQCTHPPVRRGASTHEKSPLPPTHLGTTVSKPTSAVTLSSAPRECAGWIGGLIE